MMARRGGAGDGGGRGAVGLAAWLLAVLVACAAGCVGLAPPQAYSEPQEGSGRPFWAGHGLLWEGYGPNEMEAVLWSKGESSKLGWEEPTLGSLVLFAWPGQPAQPQAALLKSRWVDREKTRWVWLTFFYADPRAVPGLAEHWRFRANSPYLVPLPLEVGGQTFWFVLAGMHRAASLTELPAKFFPQAQFLKTEPPEVYHLEVYDRDPRQGFVLPRRVWEIGHRQKQEGGDVLVRTFEGQIFALDEEPWVIAEITFGQMRGGAPLQGLRLAPWSPLSPDQILEGAKVRFSAGEHKALLRITQMHNQRLLEWKTKELAEALPGYGKAQLQDLVVKLESALLELDTRVKRVKEAQDEAARYLPQPGQAGPAPAKVPPWQVEQAHLFSQRKAIVMACLEMVKKALAQKR
ncbi:MAG: hypothetical protein HY910_06620 [Desulfarculus sp.]|nr:hypothetical protein [Desulfarculus sp.]